MSNLWEDEEIGYDVGINKSNLREWFENFEDFEDISKFLCMGEEEFIENCKDGDYNEFWEWVSENGNSILSDFEKQDEFYVLMDFIYADYNKYFWR